MPKSETTDKSETQDASEPKILILGGTTEANALASLLVDWPVKAITSLAGRTRNPTPVEGDLRSGGFGGAQGLADYIAQANIDLIVDATHPYASRISANAQHAADLTECALIRLERPAWPMQAGDRWQIVADESAAAVALPSHATVFLALGRQHIAPFASRNDLHFIMRMIDPAEVALPPHHQVVLAKPAGVAQETAFLQAKHISHIVSRNSGGSTSYAKIEAARALGLTVIMIARPAIAARVVVDNIESVLSQIRQHLDTHERST